jgi:hypothetical protein
MAIVHLPRMRARPPVRGRSIPDDLAPRRAHPALRPEPRVSPREQVARSEALAQEAVRLVAAGYCTSAILCGLHGARAVARRADRDARALGLEVTVVEGGQTPELLIRRRGGIEA